jgi:hypothetical protein
MEGVKVYFRSGAGLAAVLAVLASGCGGGNGGTDESATRTGQVSVPRQAAVSAAIDEGAGLSARLVDAGLNGPRIVIDGFAAGQTNDVVRNPAVLRPGTCRTRPGVGASRSPRLGIGEPHGRRSAAGEASYR